MRECLRISCLSYVFVYIQCTPSTNANINLSPKQILMVGGTDDKWTPPCFIADNAKRWAEYLECPYEKPAIEGG
jgi:hypothetical protein